MAEVFSYIRFSSKKQMGGDSFRRQRDDGDAWIERNGHIAANLTLHDLGVSAFRGKNKACGALSKFLEAVHQGRVKPGSILLVENLDRLSRQGVDEAYDLFRSILKAGIEIVVLKPYEVRYSKDSLNNFTDLLLPLMYFHLAYIESKNKADRLKKLWIHKREDAPTGKPFDRRCPSWISWDDKTEKFVLNDGEKAICFIFEKTIEGLGQRQILEQLQKRFAPIGSSGRWNTSFIQKVLNDRAVLGERQPKEVNEDGERVTVGSPLPNYYPAVIDEPTWYQAQAAKANRQRQKGPNSGFVNLFTGLIFNAHDGHAMHLQTSPLGKGKRQRRLVSYGHLSRLVNSDSVSVRYADFEAVFINCLTELRVDDFESQLDRHELRDREQERDGIVKRLEELEAVLANPATADIPTVITVVASLTKRNAELEELIEKLKAESHVDQPLINAQQILNKLNEANRDASRSLRLRLRTLIAELVGKILVKPEKHNGRVYTVAQIFFKNGLIKQFLFGPGFRMSTKDQSTICDFNIDLRNQDESKSKIVFGGVAQINAQSVVPAVPTVLPTDAGGAARVWLQVARASMSKDSFRVVPSKIHRFVTLLGPDLSTSSIDHNRWRRWVRWLKKEVEAGRLEMTTARVNYSRAREFVRWLISKGLTNQIDGLNLSSAAALA